MPNQQLTPRWWQRWALPLAASRPGAWFFLNVASRIDHLLLKISRGRLGTAVGFPMLILMTVGARSGQTRTTPLTYLPLGEQIVLIASNGGNARHPAWYHNLRATPRVEATVRGKTASYRAREAAGAERDELWRKVVAFNPGYAEYQRRAGDRRIPIIVLARDDSY